MNTNLPTVVLLADGQTLIDGAPLVAHVPSNWDAQIGACGRPVSPVARHGRTVEPCATCARSLPRT